MTETTPNTPDANEHLRSELSAFIVRLIEYSASLHVQLDTVDASLVDLVQTHLLPRPRDISGERNRDNRTEAVDLLARLRELDRKLTHRVSLQIRDTLAARANKDHEDSESIVLPLLEQSKAVAERVRSNIEDSEYQVIRDSTLPALLKGLKDSEAVDILHATKKSASLGTVVAVESSASIVVELSEGAAPVGYRDLLEVAYRDDHSGATIKILGQVESEESSQVSGIGQPFRATKKIGVSVSAVLADGQPYENAVISGCSGKPVIFASDDLLESVFSILPDSRNTFAPIAAGTLLGVKKASKQIELVLDPTGLRAHSAVFGQSGSGKSFSFGIILERLFRYTKSRYVVFDPNADFLNFDRIRPMEEINNKFCELKISPEEYAALQESWKARRKRGEFRKFDKNDGSLSISLTELGIEELALLLGLDRDQNSEEVSLLARIVSRKGAQAIHTPAKLLKALSEQSSVAALGLQYRITNRSLEKSKIWSKKSITRTLRRQRKSRFSVLNLRNANINERAFVSSAVLNSLYEDIKKESARKKGRQNPTFIIIDEAHNLCPSKVTDPIQHSTRRIIEEIAAEGRKYGACLMLLSQSPSKLSEQVLHQCSNLIIMKMNAASEIDILESLIDGASAELARSSGKLSLGQAICIGKMVKGPTALKFDQRWTEVGGSNISDKWALKRPDD
ncbi:MAG: ATP-binding protein [Pseudomonadota bacterium]